MKKKSWTNTILLCFFLGLLGVHRFYTGYKKLGLIQLLLTISVIGLLFSIIWWFIDLVFLLTEQYVDINGNQLDITDLTPKRQLTFKIIIIAILVISCTSALIETLNPSNNISLESDKSQTKEINASLTKTTFSGKWPFTVDKVTLYHIDINGLDGIEVTIDNKSYALTRNITDREFLPNNLWLDAEFEQVGQYKVCNDVMLDNKTCKKSLSDIINYAEKLPIEN